MKIPGRVPAVFANMILVVSLAAMWITFAPATLGGKVSYVIVNGISMEPGYHLGDLTVMRKAAAYHVGDVVTYHDGEMQAYVIHRIIEVEQDQYVLKGDNNSWIDAYRPTQEEIIGKLWIYIPRVGKLFKWMQTPLHMALSLGFLGGILMAGMLFKPSKNRKSKNSLVTNQANTLEASLYGFGFLTLIFLGLGIFAFLRPLTRSAEDVSYQQEGHFSYSATGTPVIYDTDVVRSGEPVFPRLTCFLNIAFTYNMLGGPLQNVSGNYQLVARVMDEQSGWQRTISMNQQTSFSGDAFSTTSNLDLCQIVSLVNTLKQETGLRASNFTLEIIPQVAMTANAMGIQIADTFEPGLVFRFDEVHFSLSTPEGQEDPLHSSKQNSAANPTVEANTLSILGWEPRVGTIRVTALTGFAISLGGLLLAGSYLLKSAKHNQEALIRLKYGGLLVNVYERNLAPATMVIDVTTIDELAKLAERHNTVMLHMALNFVHYYLVQCNGLTYRYVFSAGRRGVVEIEPPRQEVINYVTDVQEAHMAETHINQDDLFSYVINSSRTAKSEVTDTIILKKIRL